MKVTVLQENLAKALNIASRFTTNKAQLPILGSILLTATKTKLKISSTNLEISVMCDVGAKIEAEGSLGLPSKIITEIVGNLPGGAVSLEAEKEQIRIKTSGFNSKILGMNSSDFPKIPAKLGSESPLKLSSSDLDLLLSKVLFSVGVDETRPVLTGVLVILEKDGITAVSTDGFRLSRKKILVKSNSVGRVIVPKTVLNEVLRLTQESEEVLIDINENERQIIFGLSDVVLSSRIIEGDFPDYEKIIPLKNTIKAKTDKEELMRAVKLASIFARESANIVKFRISKDSIMVFAESSSSGAQETKVDAVSSGIEGESFEIAFNFRFVEEFIHSMNGEEVIMEFTTSDKAGVFLDTKDENYLHLIMPVKLQS